MLALAGGATFDGGVQLFDTDANTSEEGKLRHLRTFKGECNMRHTSMLERHFLGTTPTCH